MLRRKGTAAADCPREATAIRLLPAIYCQSGRGPAAERGYLKRRAVASVVSARRQQAARTNHAGEEGCLSRGMEYLNKDIGRRKLV
jgi:hypothetical protein